MKRKLDPATKHHILKNYLSLLQGKSSFVNMKEFCDTYSIHRNTPAKILKKFKVLRGEIHPDKEINYTQNIFLERAKLRKHRSLPENEQYKAFVKSYPR